LPQLVSADGRGSKISRLGRCLCRSPHRKREVQHQISCDGSRVDLDRETYPAAARLLCTVRVACRRQTRLSCRPGWSTDDRAGAPALIV